MATPLMLKKMMEVKTKEKWRRRASILHRSPPSISQVYQRYIIETMTFTNKSSKTFHLHHDTVYLNNSIDNKQILASVSALWLRKEGYGGTIRAVYN